MDTISALKSKSFVLICLFMINQYVTCLESNLPTSESRFVAEKPNSPAGDAFRDAGLFSYLKNLYQYSRNRDSDDIENDLQSLFNNNDFYRKRTASKGWNKLHGLIGKRNEQLNDNQEFAGGLTSSELLNNAGLMRNLRANKWNSLEGVWGKREDPSKQKMKSWNQLNGVWG